MQTGLYSDLLDIDKFIRINGLQEVTNPIYVDKKAPTPDGVLSYEIFGTSIADRRNRMAYIDLHGHYMHPLAAIKLSAYDRKLGNLLMSVKRYRVENGELIEDDENGDAGPEFLYKIWGTIKTKDKTTVTTKELQKFYQRPKDKLFVTKWLVIPAFYRDLNTSSGSFTKSSNELNNWYASIISYTQTLNRYANMFKHMDQLTRSRVQTLLNDIYKKLMVDTVKGNPSKFGMLRRYLQGRSVNYSARMVITASNQNKDSYKNVQVKYGYGLIPLAYTISCFYPFVVYQLKRFFDMEFLQGGKVPVGSYNDKGEVEITYVSFQSSYDENDIAAMISKYINSPSLRYDTVPTPPDINGDVYKIMLTGRFNKQDTTISRPATLTDILYIAAVRATQDKHAIITRYPLDNFNGQFPVRVSVASTVNTQPVTIGNEFYQFFPVCEGDPTNSFIDTLEFSNTYLKAMGGDFELRRGPARVIA